MRDAAARQLRVRTTAATRDHYLSHPPAGERLRDEDAQGVASLGSGAAAAGASRRLRRAECQRRQRAAALLLPPLRRRLSGGGGHVGETDIVVQNGRVRVGYEIGGLVGAAIVVHIIGERPEPG